jgi:hypothetical protein
MCCCSFPYQLWALLILQRSAESYISNEVYQQVNHYHRLKPNPYFLSFVFVVLISCAMEHYSTSDRNLLYSLRRQKPRDALQVFAAVGFYTLGGWMISSSTFKLPLTFYTYASEVRLVLLAIASLFLFPHQHQRQSLVLSLDLKFLQWLCLVLVPIGGGVVLLSQYWYTYTYSEPLRAHHERWVGFAYMAIGLCLWAGSVVWYEKLLKAGASSSSNDHNVWRRLPIEEDEEEAEDTATEIPSAAPPSAATTRTSLWMRNIQYYLFSILFLGARIVYYNILNYNLQAELHPQVRPQGDPFFDGFTPEVWFLILIYVVGGLVRPAVLLYTDSVQMQMSAPLASILRGFYYLGGVIPSEFTKGSLLILIPSIIYLWLRCSVSTLSQQPDEVDSLLTTPEVASDLELTVSERGMGARTDQTKNNLDTPEVASDLEMTVSERGMGARVDQPKCNLDSFRSPLLCSCQNCRATRRHGVTQYHR